MSDEFTPAEATVHHGGESPRWLRWLVRLFIPALGVLLVVVVLALRGFVSADDELRDANVEACERVNPVRQNQAEGIRTQLIQTEQSLYTVRNGKRVNRPLGPALEPYREQIIAGQSRRRDSLRQLAKTAAPPQSTKGIGQYLVDCKRAYPE